MKALCTVLLVCITWSLQAMAQGDTTQSRPEEGIQRTPGSGAFPAGDFQKSWGTSDLLIPATASFDTTPGGAATPHPIRRLMPDNISFMERGLWGESGFFRSIGIAGELTPESRKSELTARRTMLTMHQIGGFVTLGLMGATLYFGQKALNDAYNPGQERTDQNKHNQFVTYTIISYGLTGLLAAISPPPLIRRDETSTTTIHKTLAWVHFAGMVLTPIVGNMIKKRSGRLSYIDLPTAHFHQVSAYVTTGVFAASMIIITF
jgi:hypothetical protein